VRTGPDVTRDIISLRCPTIITLRPARRYAAQRGAHADVLARFERDMAALAAAELPRQAQAPGLRRASDLLPEGQLREWAGQCRAAHAALNDKARRAPPLAPVSHNVCRMSERTQARGSTRLREPWCVGSQASRRDVLTQRAALAS